MRIRRMQGDRARRDLFPDAVVFQIKKSFGRCCKTKKIIHFAEVIESLNDRRRYRQASTLNRCLFIIKKHNRGEVLIQGGRCSYSLSNTNSHEKKNKTQICSHLHKGGGCENCQSQVVCTPAQWQARKGSEPLSQVLRVPKIVEH